MKKRDIEQLKQKSSAELMKLVGEEREKLRVLKVDLAQGKIKNVKDMTNSRKTIARALTFMSMQNKK